MKNLFTPKKMPSDTLSFNAYQVSGAPKLRCIFLAAFLCHGAFVYAQAPTLTYSSPQTYTQTVAITPLAPTSNGVAVLAYSNTALKLMTGLNDPNGVAVDGLGHVFVATSDSGKIFRASVNGGPKAQIGPNFKGPCTIAADSGGDVYVVEYSAADVKEIPAGGGTPVVVAPHIANPYGIAVDAAGNVFVINDYKRAVVEIPAGGGPMITLNYTFKAPIGLAIDALGNLYVADEQNAGIIKIPAGGGTPVIIGSGLYGAISVAVDASGNIFVVDGGHNLVKMIPAGAGSFITLSDGISEPDGVAVDPSGNLYVSSHTLNGSVEKITPAGGYFISPALPAGLVFNITTGTISGTPAVSTPATNYTVTAYNRFGSTSAIINIKVLAASHNANLSRLQLSRGTLSPGFSPATTSYTTTVDRNVAAIEVTPTTADATATVKVNGTPASPGVPSTAVPLAIGLNTVTTTVTAQDGITTKTYTVTVNRPGSTNANLSALHISTGALSIGGLTPTGVSGLTPSFSTNTTSYTAKVGNAITSINVTPTTSDTGATVKVNGTHVVSGTASLPISLNAGPNIITVAVTAQDGTTTKTYTVTVNRPVSTNANLSALHLSVGGLTPSFSTATTSYTTEAANTTASITVIPTTSDTGATVKVNGISVASGAPSAPIALNTGPNTITVVVTAQDGTTQKTYTITDTRALSSNANLATLGQSVGSLTPGFTPGTTSYSDEVSNATASIALKPVSSDANAAIKVNGITVASGTSTGQMALAVGPNTITTVVKSQDGTTTKTYTLTITRASGAADSFVQDIGVTKPAETPALADDGILIHQGVSPNGDGVNDFFQIDNISQYPDNKLTIMNRNGQLIFEAQGYNNSSKVFDGHSNKNGRMQLPGTYFYQLEYTVNGITKHKTGFIVLKY